MSRRQWTNISRTPRVGSYGCPFPNTARDDPPPSLLRYGFFLQSKTDTCQSMMINCRSQLTEISRTSVAFHKG
ncbi:hypothetical protein V6N13_115474 [Hibiscus sabdariffa]